MRSFEEVRGCAAQASAHACERAAAAAAAPPRNSVRPSDWAVAAPAVTTADEEDSNDDDGAPECVGAARGAAPSAAPSAIPALRARTQTCGSRRHRARLHHAPPRAPSSAGCSRALGPRGESCRAHNTATCRSCRQRPPPFTFYHWRRGRSAISVQYPRGHGQRVCGSCHRELPAHCAVDDARRAGACGTTRCRRLRRLHLQRSGRRRHRLLSDGAISATRRRCRRANRRARAFDHTDRCATRPTT